MFACNCVDRSFAALLLLSAVTAIPIATPKPAVPVQIATTTNNKVFTVMRDNLVFLPPDQFFYVAKQLWRESISSATSHTSLQIYNAYTAGASLKAVSPKRYITRNGGTQPQNFTAANDAFAPFATESRLFQVKCCNCAEDSASVTFYFAQGGVTSILTPQLDVSGKLVQLGQQKIDDKLLCTTSNLKVQAFPRVIPKSGYPHPEQPSRRRRNINLLRGVAIVQLLANFGYEQFAVGVRKSTSDQGYKLVLLSSRDKACTGATWFYYRGYGESHVNATDGSITRQSAFTLQHARSRLYVSTDVLDNMALNIPGTGLILVNDTEFDSEPTASPDYRFFTRYDGPALSFWGSDAIPPSRNSSYYDRTIHIFCALHHRRYCLQPAKSGPLRVVAVSSNDTLPYPTLEDPSFGFSNFLENLNGDSIIPTFNFVRIG